MMRPIVNKTATLFMVALMAATSLAYSAGHDKAHKHKKISYEGDVVAERIKHFKHNGADIQAIFRKHMPAEDNAAIEAAAKHMIKWGNRMTDYFPEGSHSEGAKKEIWENFSDFKSKARANVRAAEVLAMAARDGDKAAIRKAARAVGGTCKACHDSYRNKK